MQKLLAFPQKYFFGTLFKKLTLNKLIKGVKDVNEMDKLYFTGEGLQIGAKFLQWFTMLADEAVMYDTNLGPYFSMSLGTAEEEHDLVDKGAGYDHFVFHYCT